MKRHICNTLFGLMVALGGGPVAQAASPAASPNFTIGKAIVTPLQDEARAMQIRIFSGAPEEVIKRLASGDAVPSGIFGFLVRLDKQVVLIDTGYGRESRPKSFLHERLAAAGVMPESVTHVLLTHLHGDHVGGLARQGRAAFPNARVLVAAQEKDYWLNPETLRQQPARKGNIELIKQNFALYGDKVQTFSFGQLVVPGITAMAAVGHTPGHTIFLLESGSQRMLFLGDLVHGAALQFADPRICASFDMDTAQAVATRMIFMDLAAQKKIPVAGAHLPPPGVGRVRAGKGDEKFVFLPGL
jgi:glyoxylase-like metal-dependent hydrolase (beta-lactamase superfamily II)